MVKLALWRQETLLKSLLSRPFLSDIPQDGRCLQHPHLPAMLIIQTHTAEPG